MRKIKDLLAKVNRAREQLSNLTPEDPSVEGVQLYHCQEHSQTVQGILAKEQCKSCNKSLCYICGNSHLTTHTCIVDCKLIREGR